MHQLDKNYYYNYTMIKFSNFSKTMFENRKLLHNDIVYMNVFLMISLDEFLMFKVQRDKHKFYV